MTIGLDLPKQILNAQTEAWKTENIKNENVRGMIRKDIPKEKLEPYADGTLCLNSRTSFVEEPVEIMDREVKRLKRSRIPIVKVQWNSRRSEVSYEDMHSIDPSCEIANSSIRVFPREYVEILYLVFSCFGFLLMGIVILLDYFNKQYVAVIPFGANNSMMDDWGINPSDSKNELRVALFLGMDCDGVDRLGLGSALAIRSVMAFNADFLAVSVRSLPTAALVNGSSVTGLTGHKKCELGAIRISLGVLRSFPMERIEQGNE
ncbi:hypothetical protein Tco_0144976 [Tanacetum coccineum]